MKKIGLYFFTNDLRFLHNELLSAACNQVDELIGVVMPIHISPFVQQHSVEKQIGQQRLTFWQQSLEDLAQHFDAQNQRLYTLKNIKADDLIQLIETCQVSYVYYNQHPGSDERDLIIKVQRSLPNIEFITTSNNTLLDIEQLPFEMSKLPSSFTRFRKTVEAESDLLNSTPQNPVPRLPEVSGSLNDALQSNPSVSPVKFSNAAPTPRTIIPTSFTLFEGGESAGLTHLKNYFQHSYASHYKQTRNAFDGMSHSTKLSPWLAVGCLSPKTIVSTLHQYEDLHGSNESTYWIKFELLWREYFYWSARVAGHALFSKPVIKKPHIGDSPNSEALKAFSLWKTGNTNYPIVNACMRELNATGYMSNRGRQLAASCLVYELGCDWRWGAAYFETQLVDYDVASNWGNWSYIAGMNGQQARHFDLDKQTQMYDPQHDFIRRWVTTDKQHQIAE
ncbi:DASH family cryptochrome [Vibrio fortis]|uniref:DASH family cryptochrome n=1 Tax=Vibrio fortis TaxID=212667 RepID=UPI0021C381D6|nr:DASH family cryptochrome [Vibrio fortis]